MSSTEHTPPASSSAATDAAALDAFKLGVRDTWSSGDLPELVKTNIWDVGARIVRHAQVRRGEDVLDVGCGTGNAAIPAALDGGNVTGLDLTPELFDAARAEAAAVGVTIDWVEGDAEALPFGDATFDLALSTFGCMFAPRHELAAREIGRVLRPGGRIALTTWTPEGAVGRFFNTVGAYLPEPPPFASSPILWGSQEHVREIFAGTGIDLEFKRESIQQRSFEEVDDALEYWTTKFGPLINAKRITEENGTWPRLRDELAEYYGRNEPTEYLVILGRKS